MEDGAPGLSVSEPGNMATALLSGERVAAIAGAPGVHGERLETGRSVRFSHLLSLLSKKKKKIVH